MEANPALLGVGYIIGTKIACIMVAGGILQAFVLVPVIRFFGEGLSNPLYPAAAAIASMDAETIYKVYVRYIGAGAVAAGGIISLCRALPLIVASIASGLRDMRGSVRSSGGELAAPIATCPWPPSSSVRSLLVTAIWVFLGLDPQAGGGWSLADCSTGTGYGSIWPPRH